MPKKRNITHSQSERNKVSVQKTIGTEKYSKLSQSVGHKVSYQEDLEYKDQCFNFSINTKYLCKKSDDCKCKTCFSFYEKSVEFIKIFEKLDEYRTWSWRKIESSNNNTSCGTMSVLQLNVKDMVINHLKELKLDDESLYKMEISNKHRVWGIRRDNIFYLIWNDSAHHFYKHYNSNYTKLKASH